MATRAIQRVLVGCPGEVGASIVHSVERGGLEAVAVFDDAGAEASFVEEAAYAVHLRADPGVDPWTDGTRLVSVALDSGADAVHPGVSGLARDGAFARMVANVGLAWIGPRARHIEEMSDRDVMRRRAREVGLEDVPHSPPVDDPAEIGHWIAHFGPPLWVRPAAKGRGRGAWAATAEDARRIADGCGGAVLVDRAIEGARHLVFVVIADGEGNALYLGDHERTVADADGIVRLRECPSPGLDLPLRARLGDGAASFMEDLAYLGVGGVEFLVGADGRAWFHDLDPGLPPGYRVNDVAYGIDVVTAQIQLAGGETLGWSQDELAPARHAIEGVIVGEGQGVIEELVLPHDLDATTSLGVGSRFDARRDPVIARIRAEGPTRHAALVRLRASLPHVRVRGVVHDTRRLMDLLGDPETWEGRLRPGLWPAV